MKKYIFIIITILCIVGAIAALAITAHKHNKPAKFDFPPEPHKVYTTCETLI